MTTITIEDIVALGRQASLTSSVLAEWAEHGTPKQREHLHGLLTAECESRQASRRHRLLRAAKLPTMKSFEGYDWTQISFPHRLRQRTTDQPGLSQPCPKPGALWGCWYWQNTPPIALAAATCQQGIPARYFTTVSLVMQLRRAKENHRLDKELAYWPAINC